ncbi:XRE family transcriptional regulator [Acidithiobacillus thiooxidans]|uniref:helix-turn-helix domain-containing protein n=1 Tax=Acidithiobacillus thiooxidans TaxID=930 RepID=UPI0002624D9D|nr:XRE family transcriptional regulator [Acidithiobacillus thiooxidans]MBU2810281.1 XRE family transcriptional regulator [Acidithiobacillus thiooxidans]
MASYREDITTPIKLKLIGYIRDMVVQKGWTQTEAAKNLDISRSRFCRIMGGQTKDISEWRLMQCLAMLGSDVKIFIVPTQCSQGKIEIVDISAPPKQEQNLV